MPLSFDVAHRGFADTTTYERKWHGFKPLKPTAVRRGAPLLERRHQVWRSDEVGEIAGRLPSSPHLWRRRLALFVTFTSLGMTASAGVAAATPGDLDATFSEDGRALTDFPGGADQARDVARQSDGKLVAVGGAGGNFTIARYNVDGSLDRTFAGDGRQVTDFGSASDRAAGVAIRPDGRILVAGQGRGRFALARYRPNGSLDRQFSEDGKQSTDFTRGVERANDLALSPTGKITVAGDSSKPYGGAVALARYHADGTLDRAFSGDGKQLTGEPGDEWVLVGYEAKALKLLPRGGVAVVGTSSYSDICCISTDLLLLRYGADGRLDKSFGQDGRVFTRFRARGDNSEGFDIARQSGGRLVVAGFSQPIDLDSEFHDSSGPSRFALARYRADGSLDRAFSGDGRQTTGFGPGDAEGHGLAVQGDGRIVVGGTAVGNFALARYRGNGDPDTTFSGDGKTLTAFGSATSPYGWAGANRIALGPGNRVVAAGFAGGGAQSRFAVARYKGG